MFIFAATYFRQVAIIEAALAAAGRKLKQLICTLVFVILHNSKNLTIEK